MKKFFITLIVTVSVLALLVNFVGNIFLEESSRKALNYVDYYASDYGLKVKGLDFREASISSVNSVGWKGIFGAFEFKEYGIPNRLSISSLDLNFHSTSLAQIVARGVQVTPEKTQNQNSSLSESIRGGKYLIRNFRMTFPMDVLNPEEGLQTLAREMRQIMLDEKNTELRLDGERASNISLDGEAEFFTSGKYFKVRMTTKKVGRKTKIVLHKEDVRRLSPLFEKNLTDAEIGVIADYPLRAPFLLFAKEYAEAESKIALSTNPSSPEDAHRHVLWSYTLTKKFGADFAKLVTDAHEQGDTGNSDAERKRDLHNNAVGRDFAQRGIDEAKIYGLVLRSPKVRR